MIKKLIQFFLFLPLLFNAQVVENDWINYSQSYFKIPIYSTGIYKITYNDLLNAGVNVSVLNPKNIQLFNKGSEQYIYIQGESDGKFDAGDFIEFFGEKNDGTYDANLFLKASDLTNPHYSMFSDTNMYFLTWNNLENNRRWSIETDVDFSRYSATPYVWSESIYLMNSAFMEGELTFFKKAVPEFSLGAGYGSTKIKYNTSGTFQVNTPNAYILGPEPTIKTIISGRASGRHEVKLEINDQEILSSAANNFDVIRVDKTFPISLIQSSNAVKFSNLPSSNPQTNNDIAVMNLSIRYPRTTDLGNGDEFLFYLPTGGVELKDYLSFNNFNSRNSTTWLYDLTQNKKVVVQAKSGVFSALVPNSGEERKCYLTSESIFRSVSKILPVSGTSPYFVDYKTLAEQSLATYYIITSSTLKSAADDYATYRTQSGHPSIVFDVDQLYDQYSYGIKKNPLAIRNLMIEAYNEWSTKPKFLLLLGKSVSVASSRSGIEYQMNLVPTWGPLGTDIGFTNFVFGVSVLDPLVPTGRIAANTPEQVSSYLNKVQAYESAEKAEWMKNILHFGGGPNQVEQETYAGYLKGYQKIAEGAAFGAKVHTFLKSTSDPLQLNLSDSVTNLVNNGVTLMTFFGHAYSGNFDQSIDEPENYTNVGKYGFILANSCLIGNIHTTNTLSGSERFVLAEDKGTIGFIGSSSLGIPSYLNRYSSNFYQNLCVDHYGKSVGEIIKYSIQAIQDSANNASRDVCMHMTLHGDPAIVLNAHLKPDYTLFGEQGNTQPRIYFNPSEVSNEVDSFTVNIIITNIGKAQNDTFDVLVTRRYPDNKTETYSFTIQNIYFKDTLSVTLPVNITQGLGSNTIEVTLDQLNFVDEVTKANNSASVNVLIKSVDITPTYPYEFAVVDDLLTTIKASTGDAYAASKQYVFQIDTTAEFNSPIFSQDTITSIGGVVEWNPNLYPDLKTFYNKFSTENTLETPQVFFWRVAAVNSSNSVLWKSSSFQYVKNKRGWGQAHFHQLEKDEYDFMEYNFSERKYNFIEQTKLLQVNSHSSPYLPYRVQTGYKIDGSIICQNSTAWSEFIMVGVIDKKTLKPWHAHENGDFGHLNYGTKVTQDWNEYNFYYYAGSESQIDSLVSLINHVPDSNYILLYSFLGHYLPSWYSATSGAGVKLKTVMSAMGADIDSMLVSSNSMNYAFAGQKGSSSKAVEAFGGTVATAELKMTNNWLSGTITSTTIGPATSWGSLHWQIDESENGNTLDTNLLSLYKIDTNGTSSLVFDTLLRKGDVLDLSNISAQEYPQLELSTYFNDELNRTPNKLARWQVLFQDIPDAAINPIKLGSFSIKDTVAQGEKLTFVTAIENITDIDMDSIQVSYWIVDENFNISTKTFKQLAPLKANEFIYDTVLVETGDLKGLASFWYEINPYDGVKKRQIEKHHFNNIYKHQFQINRDVRNPILDVTFDGIHILDGDIVSSSPNIVITLDDENQYFPIDDPSLIKVYLNYPSATAQDSLILLDPSEYQFIEASLPENKARIELDRSFSQEGIYELRVMAKDRASNISGKGDGHYDYRISFKVVLVSAISEVLTWPNPFSTSTQFVFVLTGSEVPSNILIQITTITGKIVREITKEELGPINIGRNISEFKWDGTDQYGDKLANGVYLYRVIIQNDGQNMRKLINHVNVDGEQTTITDKFFKNGMGKIYILR